MKKLTLDDLSIGMKVLTPLGKIGTVTRLVPAPIYTITKRILQDKFDRVLIDYDSNVKDQSRKPTVVLQPKLLKIFWESDKCE